MRQSGSTASYRLALRLYSMVPGRSVWNRCKSADACGCEIPNLRIKWSRLMNPKIRMISAIHSCRWFTNQLSEADICSVSVTVIPHRIVFGVRVAPALTAFARALIRLPSAATLPRRYAAELAAVIIRIVGFPIVVAHFTAPSPACESCGVRGEDAGGKGLHHVRSPVNQGKA